jgi:hypothetical protein
MQPPPDSRRIEIDADDMDPARIESAAHLATAAVGVSPEQSRALGIAVTAEISVTGDF